MSYRSNQFGQKSGLKHNALFRIFLIIYIFLSGSSNSSLFGQDLEPRSLSNIPVGTNFVIGGYNYSWGSTLLDSSIPIEDINSKIHGIVAAYARSINFFGMGSKVDIVIPYAIGDWDGIVEGTYVTASRIGFGDPRVRLSFNFLGSPALGLAEFIDYKPQTIAGISIQVYAPLGQYFEEKIVNLGTNRWTIKPEFGIAKYAGKWIFEGYLSVLLYTSNNAFLVDNTQKSQPFYTAKLHVIRSLPKNIWITFDAGYGLGGKTELNDVERDDRISSIRLGTTLSVPVAKKHAIKLSYYSHIRFEKGSDYDALLINYQYRWYSKKSLPKK